MSGSLRELNWLTKAAAAAEDSALQRVVTMLDGLKNRGDADKVLDMARKRLRALRPPRPLGFPRVLFMPMDGAIVPSARWRRGDASLPRSVLQPMANAVFAAMPEAESAALSQACEGRTTADGEVICDIGAKLWPSAARLLPAQPPADWEGTTGLVAADYAAVAALARPLWQEGAAIWAAADAGPSGPPEEVVRTALAGLLPHGHAPVAMALATILARASQPGQVALGAARLDPQARAVAQAALDAMVDEGVPQLDMLDLRNATEAVALLARRLDDLENCSLMAGDRQRRVAALRSAADEACRSRFVAAAEQQVLAPVTKLATASKVEDAEVASMEAQARGLRALEIAGRRIGSPGAYDRALRNMAEALAVIATRVDQPEGLQRMDVVRLVEIVAGPEAAEAVMGAEVLQ